MLKVRAPGPAMTHPLAPPPEKPKPSKAMVYGVAIAASLLSKVPKLVAEAFTPLPRVCPKCSFRTVEKVGSYRTKGGKDLSYWRCSACAARYRAVGEGPFSTPSADEWQKRVGNRFTR